MKILKIHTQKRKKKKYNEISLIKIKKPWFQALWIQMQIKPFVELNNGSKSRELKEQR